jgi:hypothetical protein
MMNRNQLQLRIRNTPPLPRIVTFETLKQANDNVTIKIGMYRFAADQWVLNYKEEGNSREVRKLQEKVVIAHDLLKQAEQYRDDVHAKLFSFTDRVERITDEVNAFTDDEIPY